MSVASTPRRRRRVLVRGVVQGVGFRPFVHRLASELGLNGFVGNDATQVVIEIEGSADSVNAFIERLRTEAPPLASIEHVALEVLEATGATGFVIAESLDASGTTTLVPADTALCTDCLRELRDPSDRRYRHPFITCTNCGPRYTIIESLPYDRPATTMADFPMCSACAAEYGDVTDRRFHAQPVSCHNCGPQLRMCTSDGGKRASGIDALQATISLLRNGGIAAIKGMGGYHLVCDATNEAAVRELRRRKNRGDKPFAVMVQDEGAAARFASVDTDEAHILRSPANPIVLLRSSAAGIISGSVAPGNPLIGVLLPPSGLHHLLVDAESGLQALVMTSANRSGEPIAHRDDDALERLGDLVDAFLLHDRRIEVPCDDSVVRVVDGEVMPIRRSRGFAPLPVRLTFDAPDTLAVGAELKNTFCVASGPHAWVSQHIGDMENLDTLESFERSVAHLTALQRISPSVIAADIHPDYLTRSWARRAYGVSNVSDVQHHHAHIVSAMVEHGLGPDAQVLGFAFDGTGYGSDGAIWGGEVLRANYDGFVRVQHLRAVPLPGGDAAVRHPNRVALAHLWAAGIAWTDDIPAVAATPERERALLTRQFDSGFRCTPTTSMGRLFDAVASLLGVRHEASYEAQAAMELEGLAIAAFPADAAPIRDYSVGFGTHDMVSDTPVDGGWMDAAPLFAAMVSDLRAGVPIEYIALRFHRAVAEAVVACACQFAGPDEPVVLSGGVFQNALLLRLCRDRLRAEGYRVLTHRHVPPNDGGLALGQAAVAAWRHMTNSPYVSTVQLQSRSN